MIIFDLDTLADDTHRRHFIEPSVNHLRSVKYDGEFAHILTGELWQPDIASYNAACGDDVLIHAVHSIYECYCMSGGLPIIWTSRCESTKKETEKWCKKHGIYTLDMRMHPIGNTEPAHVLKERWLEDTLIETKWGNKYGVDFVFDSDPDSIAMFRRYGVYVFDCRQG